MKRTGRNLGGWGGQGFAAGGGGYI